MVISETEDDHTVTVTDKYRETFGVDPVTSSHHLICPLDIGFEDRDCSKYDDCVSCKIEFWDSEYKEPTKEASNEDSASARK